MLPFTKANRANCARPVLVRVSMATWCVPMHFDPATSGKMVWKRSERQPHYLALDHFQNTVQYRVSLLNSRLNSCGRRGPIRRIWTFFGAAREFSVISLEVMGIQRIRYLETEVCFGGSKFEGNTCSALCAHWPDCNVADADAVHCAGPGCQHLA